MSQSSPPNARCILGSQYQGGLLMQNEIRWQRNRRLPSCCCTVGRLFSRLVCLCIYQHVLGLEGTMCALDVRLLDYENPSNRYKGTLVTAYGYVVICKPIQIIWRCLKSSKSISTPNPTSFVTWYPTNFLSRLETSSSSLQNQVRSLVTKQLSNLGLCHFASVFFTKSHSPERLESNFHAAWQSCVLARWPFLAASVQQKSAAR